MKESWKYAVEHCIGTVKYQESYDTILYIEYDPVQNSFYDECGKHITNIFELITPNNLYLFRQKPEEYSYFTHRNNSNVVCKFIMNGVYTNEEDYSFMPCQFSSGGGCQFSDNSETYRKEICAACRG